MDNDAFLTDIWSRDSLPISFPFY